MYNYGDFGNLKENYKKGRRRVPLEVIKYIFNKLNKNKPLVLDLGCGTGISTRQLAPYSGYIIGVDKDEDMISNDSINYKVSDVSNLPFENSYFDLVTAFSAFHWFCDKKSILEIKRVLKTNGIFCVINKEEKSGLKNIYRSVLEKYVSEELPSIKKDYEPNIILKQYGFVSIKKKVFKVVENYNLEEALLYLQSVSLWNLVNDNFKEKVLNDLRNVLSKRDYIERTLDIVVVYGSLT
ncbi:MAG: hypothetical protein COV57_02035 [Candidatus Liptonbacteria bacterium CG11_big_fil_rev_8_21_14_0_20_35_14]|uniref:Methyltransferase type 11 domain-containing protein n=1 Tax=Candidatus Liptonbacteria bacterium CG11_big_fil_rev_8_21_14_0_20_35_14 TaxID=1974634 RepID=A0A2H0N7M9_9BACT|nr:MAG: hypothetical protein COV57_02035 [Candidatus Liptonbacteria bacterium CG11_big_fil_rev_8_21_14_0_20_35_14]